MDGVSFLALLTLISDIGITLFILIFILHLLGFATKVWGQLNLFFSKNALLFSWIVALTATLGSLYLSEVRGFVPCILCWYQRILMYPLSIILGVAYFLNDRKVYRYALSLSLPGTLIAGYHYLMQINPNVLTPCSTVGFSVSCSERFSTSYGYITIPFMSLTAFLLITIGMFFAGYGKKFRG